MSIVYLGRQWCYSCDKCPGASPTPFLHNRSNWWWKGMGTRLRGTLVGRTSWCWPFNSPYTTRNVGNWRILHIPSMMSSSWSGDFIMWAFMWLYVSYRLWHNLSVFSTWRCEQLKSSPIAAKLEGQNQGNPRIRMLYVFRQGDLPKLDLQVDRGTDFTAWKAQWEAYRRLSGLDKNPTSNRWKCSPCVSTTRHWLLSTTSIGFTAEQRGSVPSIVEPMQC